MRDLSTAEARVLSLLQQHRVLRMPALCEGAACSHMTVFRGLRRYGYCTSYNANSGFYTLHDIPEFDAQGLWQYGPARFSRHGTLLATILAWVEQSRRGLSAVELEEGLGVRVRCQVSELVRVGKLASIRAGSGVVYVCAKREQRAMQEERWRSGAWEPAPGSGLALPEGLSAPVVLRLLVEMIRAPEASAASLARRVSAQGERLRAAEVRSVIGFWKLDEKRGACR